MDQAPEFEKSCEEKGPTQGGRKEGERGKKDEK